MGKKSMAIILAALISVSAAGCSTGAAERQEPSSSASETTQADVAVNNLDEAKSIVAASFEQLQTQGCIETVTTPTDSFVLYFDPTQADNQSASINLTDTAKSELIADVNYFAVGSAKMLIEDATTEFALIDGGFSLTAPEWLPMNFYVENGLVVRADGGTETDFWKAEIDYRTDAAYTEILLGLK